MEQTTGGPRGCGRLGRLLELFTGGTSLWEIDWGGQEWKQRVQGERAGPGEGESRWGDLVRSE